MPLSEETKKIQETLAYYVRSGKEISLPGITPNRLHHYRRLFFNMVLDTLETAFPLALKLLGFDKFKSVVEDFHLHHDCLSDQVIYLPEEFKNWVKLNTDLVKDFPFIDELLDFEWKELELYIQENAVFPEKKSPLNFKLKEPWILNPESELLNYEFPVHLRSPEDISIKDKGNYFCLIFRQPLTFKVIFFDLSPVWAYFFQLINEEILPNDALSKIQKETALEKEGLHTQAEHLFIQLKNQGFIL